MQKLLNREEQMSKGTENGSLGLSLSGETKRLLQSTLKGEKKQGGSGRGGGQKKISEYNIN